MERNIGDQLNKAFEAYRQVSIEKDNAKKQLQQMTEYYERHTQKLQKQVEDQQQLISQLKEKLLEARLPAGDMKCESRNHLFNEASAYRKMQYLDTGKVVPHVHTGSSINDQEMADVFEAIQGNFRQIRSLTRRQKDHLKRFHGGSDTSKDQRFSMPIQCTDRTEDTERRFPSALRAADDTPLPSGTACPEDRDLVESLAKLSVRFPPPADSEYDFLNSAPERPVGLSAPAKRPLSAAPCSPTDEETVDAPAAFVYPPSPSHCALSSPCCSSSSSSSLSHETVRGPQQSLWRPELCNAVHMGTEVTAALQSGSPDKCAFCHAVVPQDRMNSHLYSHFSHKDGDDDDVD